MTQSPRLRSIDHPVLTVADIDLTLAVYEEGPVPRTGAQRPLMSLHISDPDGNLIEIATSE